MGASSASSSFARSVAAAGRRRLRAGAVAALAAALALGLNTALVGAQSPPSAPPAPKSAPLPSTEPYDAYRPPPASDRVGTVPVAASQPFERLPEYRWVAGGAPEQSNLAPVSGFDFAVEEPARIVMSRDGSEGWAVGPGLPELAVDLAQQGTGLYHWDGNAWSRCDRTGVPGLAPPDPACASFAPFSTVERGFANSSITLRLLDAGRIPLESDEFEVVALGSPVRDPADGVSRNAMFLYSDGRWQVKWDWMRQIDPQGKRVCGTSGNWVGGCQVQYPRRVAFNDPDDGWIITDNNHGRTSGLLHFDGASWTSCVDNWRDPPASSPPILVYGAQGCRGYGAGRADLPPLRGSTSSGFTVGEPGPGFTTVDTRVYLYGRVGTKPAIYYHDPGADWTAADGGYLQGVTDPETAVTGTVTSVSVVKGLDGRYTGWASLNLSDGKQTLLRLSDGTEFPAGASVMPAPGQLAWRPWRVRDASFDPNFKRFIEVVTLKPDGRALAAAVPEHDHSFPVGDENLIFNPRHHRWEVAVLPFGTQHDRGSTLGDGGVAEAVAPDGAGGAWLVSRTGLGYYGWNWTFYRYTDAARRPVFQEVPSPVREHASAAAGSADGTFWIATREGVLYRYDRFLGWDRVAVPGWAAPSKSHDLSGDGGVWGTKIGPGALALGPDGEGVVVGVAGQIADLGPWGARMDPASGTVSRDLLAAGVAPDGSAMVGGVGGTLLWRPAGGGFARIDPPVTFTPYPSSDGNAPDSNAIGLVVTGISMPRPDRAWLTVSQYLPWSFGGVLPSYGRIYRGELTADGWRWTREDLNEQGKSLTYACDLSHTVSCDDRHFHWTKYTGGTFYAYLRAVAVDAAGHGYAVGDQGVVLERTGEGAHPWRRLPQTSSRADLYSVTLPAGEGEGALIGSMNGMVLTLVDGRFQVSQPADPYDPRNIGYVPATTTADSRVVGLALLPGETPGQVEAWAVTQASSYRIANQGRDFGPAAVYHYTNDPSDRLLDPVDRAEALPDAPAPRPGELSFAAFGKSDCHAGSLRPVTLESRLSDFTNQGQCFVWDTQLSNAVVSRRIVDEVLGRAARPGGPSFALFSGDIERSGSARLLRTWVEQVADPLRDGGLPLFGAIGGQDLDDRGAVYRAKASTNLAWRYELVGQPAPWGQHDTSGPGVLDFRPVADPLQPAWEQEESAFSGAGSAASSNSTIAPQYNGQGLYRAGPRGARTHYAFDVVDTKGTDDASDDKATARVVVVDNSLRSLSASDAQQNPPEPQVQWVERVLCQNVVDGIGPCTRGKDEPAIVLAEDPTYTYGSGAYDTATDATAFEALLMRYKVSLVVSGRMGGNALYWATAPGVHEPCPGGDYQTEVPESGARSCGRNTPAPPPPPEGAKALSEALSSLGAPPAPVVDPDSATKGLGQILPFVVASGAGGVFGPQGEDETSSANQGFWHGYTVVRLDASGDPRKTIFEQRPVFDYVSIYGREHTLRPGRRVLLRGFGREALGQDQSVRYDDINTPAITHRYDLVRADPNHPWLPLVDPASTEPNRYVPLDPTIGTLEPQTGQVQAGKGNHPRTYAIAILSVSSRAATWPLVFEPRKSYTPRSARLIPAPPVRPVVASALPEPPLPPPPPPPSNTASAGAPAPTPPLLQAPPLEPPPPSPPIPSVPSPPPASPVGTSLNLLAEPVGLLVTPPVSVVPPAPPATLPAPPTTAHTAQRQRKVARAQSGAGGPGSEIQQLGGDLAAGREGATGAQTMTRRDRVKPGPSFTALAAPEQPSAWARGALYGGGLTVVALALAAGFLTVRPTPRRRPPEVPAPARCTAPARRTRP